MEDSDHAMGTLKQQYKEVLMVRYLVGNVVYKTKVNEILHVMCSLTYYLLKKKLMKKDKGETQLCIRDEEIFFRNVMSEKNKLQFSSFHSVMSDSL